MGPADIIPIEQKADGPHDTRVVPDNAGRQRLAVENQVRQTDTVGRQSKVPPSLNAVCNW